ncbi:hypothetical protein VB151_13120 [Xanthomonas fragariae]|uniref:Uncharacterized protein n=1 Tax=Xanthomonas fragariae TaxID=48664 RepID=A0A1Y6HIS9_9XANT|nr:hypothetical protein [Xanthomonas fragariae]ENZ95176.1 hypothetical protein O1K_12580 [Xanthomonas fragariae LMG 25863]MBL9222587.1 hypothetical protein [Xanthomonas fragariae]MDM7582332.1 hypothetical protein [Xanthomonas fragariae]MEA5174599.1 hypothetical protein [Xanthomonas fragariae]MEA5187312.1 hypothetical protein [Xanthomonas fragariae]
MPIPGSGRARMAVSAVVLLATFGAQPGLSIQPSYHRRVFLVRSIGGLVFGPLGDRYGAMADLKIHLVGFRCVDADDHALWLKIAALPR